MICASAVVPTAVLAKVKLAGDDRDTTGVVPVPLKATVCGDPLALSAMLTFAFNAPDAVGSKVTVIAQLTPAATLAPHVLVCEKEPALTPEIEMPRPVPLRLTASLPALVRVMACVADAVFTEVLAKVKLAGDRFTTGTLLVCDDPAESGDISLELD
jgi:hypothetical protein